MPYVLLILGEMLLVSGVTGNQTDFYNLLKSDFTGAGNFINWLAAIAIVGAIGYVPKMRPLSNAFLVLILVVLIIHQDPQQLFGSFQTAIKNASAAPPTVSNAATTQSTSTNPTAAPNTNKNTNTGSVIGQAAEAANVIGSSGQTVDFISQAAEYASALFA